MLDLKIKEHELGMLVLMQQGLHVYTPAHAALLRSVKEPIAIAVSNARRYQEILSLQERLTDDNRAMSRELERLSGNQVVGAEFGLRQVMEMVGRVAPLSSPVLLLGETGTGKEVIANAIHQASPRRSAGMVRVQCGAIPATMLDSELFGHEKGAFTGAFEVRRGRFERADGGTIFLDEIGELTPEAQVKLLRVLQDQEFERLGGNETIRVDVRVIAATHRDLQAMVQQGRFREDLFFRLNVFPIFIPPLRQCKEDIPSLVGHFLARKSRELVMESSPELAPGALARLVDYDWPGNVRELQNIVERALILSRGGTVSFPDMSGFVRQATAPASAQTSSAATVRPMNEVVSRHIGRALAASGGRVEGPGGAAEMLQVHPSTLRGRMRRLGIPFGRQARW